MSPSGGSDGDIVGNRAILECKDCSAAMLFNKSSLVIEPYWNVKCGHLQGFSSDNVLVIEPYWNVKSNFLTSSDSSIQLVIEPYWNVKCNGYNP